MDSCPLCCSTTASSRALHYCITTGSSSWLPHCFSMASSSRLLLSITSASSSCLPLCITTALSSRWLHYLFAASSSPPPLCGTTAFSSQLLLCITPALSIGPFLCFTTARPLLCCHVSPRPRQLLCLSVFPRRSPYRCFRVCLLHCTTLVSASCFLRLWPPLSPGCSSLGGEDAFWLIRPGQSCWGGTQPFPGPGGCGGTFLFCPRCSCPGCLPATCIDYRVVGALAPAP